PADGLSGNSYGNNAYGKPALGYLALKELLGDAEFGRALHGFMDRWHGKHPIPWDFFNTVNNVAGMPAPVDLRLGFTDNTSDVVHEMPAIWAADLRRASVSVPTPKTLQSLALQ